MEKADAFDLIQKLPKAELHVHLEGSVTPEFWQHLLTKHQKNKPAPSIESLEKRFQFNSFWDFIEAYKDIIKSFKSADDFYELTREVLLKAVAQNICYIEMMLTPWFLNRMGINQQDLMSEIDRAAKEIEADHDIEFKLIFDGPRNFGEEVVMDVFKMASEDKTGRVIGVGLGGDEKNYPPALFENCFNFARSQGLKTIAHAGETAGEQSMNDAINLLHASRLGHAIGISEGSELESLILDREITLDLCPWSNVATRVINQIEDHPMLDYLNRGLPITLNSDDPGLFFSSLTKEFETMVSLYNISAIQLGQLTKNAIDGSFMDINKKQSLTRRIDKIVAEFGLP